MNRANRAKGVNRCGGELHRGVRGGCDVEGKPAGAKDGTSCEIDSDPC
jgi:hypothetical protein